ncbi:M50 family metallopeptidase [Microbacterium ulmi]|uniref:Site-2 protease family protein n=1 Tax=Microbacterium ulmi TaxID=179095 RepID=A0A7Y2Q1A5_9MICO|nr:M50 family metallopeptidase [Microbacterium ulmi]NII70520.1 membrane-associated protease RseP (regulator of RpoE activity) [Microbacterium ulmi]NNH05198.1 site-2 protease family protein [Microbacterium ulmi]
MTVLAFVIGIALMVVGLAVSIALHELGHLWPAKKFGVRVGQYMIGFGPTLWSTRKGETEYGFKAIPLGGYISMAGMYPPSPRDGAALPAGEGRAGRAGGGFFATMVQDARAANDETLEGRDDERVFYRLSVWKRVVIMLGGPIMNFLFAIVLFSILFSAIGIQTATSTVSALSECVPATASAECAPGDPQAPAAAAGLQPGDRIVSADGAPVSTFADLAAVVQASPAQQLTLVVEREGTQETISVTPATVEAAGADGTAQEVGFLGVRPAVEYVRQPIWAGAQAAVENAGAVAGIIWQLPVKVYDTAVSLVTGQERDPDGPLSIVGAGILAGEVAAVDAPILNRVAGFLGLLASLNIALFVFNLIPLLPLDGGHVVVALWDGLKRTWARLFRRPPPKPVDASKLVPVTFVVFIALAVMGGILIIADLVNPVSILS